MNAYFTASIITSNTTIRRNIERSMTISRSYSHNKDTNWRKSQYADYKSTWDKYANEYN